MVQKSTAIFIRSRGSDYGPFNEEEAGNLVASGHVSFAAWVFSGDTWHRLAAIEQLASRHPEFEALPTHTPDKKTAKTEIVRSAPAAPVGGTALSTEAVWFFIRDKKKFGPYSAGDIISQVQRKELAPGAFVWRPGFSTWQRMSQVGEFMASTLKGSAKALEKVDVLVKRKYPRAPYEVDVIAHDNARAIEAKSMVIGEGGLFLATPKPMHAVGTRLKLHFREGGTLAFNAIAEVISVVRGDSPGYCMRFVAVSDVDRKRIAKYVTDTSSPKR